jgi:hypothetical protein
MKPIAGSGHSVVEQELATRGVMPMLGWDTDDLAIGLQQSAAEARCGVQKSCGEEQSAVRSNVGPSCSAKAEDPDVEPVDPMIGASTYRVARFSRAMRDVSEVRP